VRQNPVKQKDISKYMLVKVWTELSTGRYATLVAKIFDQKDDIMKIRYLSPTSKYINGYKIFKYEDELYEIDDESVVEYLDDFDETDLGYKPIDDGGFIKQDSDSDYVPTESSDDDDNDSDNYVDE
jgi:hypothetical protein